MSLKAQLEAIIYAAETPITAEQITALVNTNRAAEGVSGDAEIKSRVRACLEELVASYDSPDHGIEIRQVAGGYRMSTKPEQHEVVRSFAKSLKPPVRLSLPALETLAVIAYKQPATVPEISEIRGVDSGGVIRNPARPQIDYDGGTEAGDWASDSVQDDQRIPYALWAERCERTAQHEEEFEKLIPEIVSGGVDANGRMYVTSEAQGEPTSRGISESAVSRICAARDAGRREGRIVAVPVRKPRVTGAEARLLFWPMTRR